MPLVKAQCTNCGAALEVDDSKEAAVCPYCNTPYIVEKAINNYTTNITNNINAQTVIINSNENKEFKIEKGVLVSYKGNKDCVIIPEDVKEIGAEAFEDCNYLVSVIIPNNVISIGAYAFRQCNNLKEITLPSSIKKYGDSIFYNCSNLEKVIIKGRISDYEYCGLFSYSGIKEAVVPKGIKKLKDAFDHCSQLKKVVLSDTVETIEGSFRYCTSLEYISIPSSVKDIGGGTEGPSFEGCSDLKRIDIMNIGNISIYWKTFIGCHALTELNANNPNGISAYEYDYQGHKPADTQPLHDVLLSLPQFERNRKIKEKAKKTSGCYVATCVYGSYDCPQVWTLRRYRDDTLGAMWYGRLFIKLSYAISPTLVRWFGKTNWFKKMWRGKLDRMVKKLNGKGVEDTPYQDKQW